MTLRGGNLLSYQYFLNPTIGWVMLESWLLKANTNIIVELFHLLPFCLHLYLGSWILFLDLTLFADYITNSIWLIEEISPIPKFSRVLLRKLACFFSLFPLQAVNFLLLCLVKSTLYLPIFFDYTLPFLLSFIIVLGEFWEIADKNMYIQFTKFRSWSINLFLIYQKPNIRSF